MMNAIMKYTCAMECHKEPIALYAPNIDLTTSFHSRMDEFCVIRMLKTPTS